MKDGLDLGIRFSYRVNHLRYCGPREAEDVFISYINQKTDPQKVQDCLTRFEGLTPYLYAIAKKHNKNPFDYEVIEAYWIGNKLLEGWTKKEMAQILDALEKRGLPASLVKEKKEELIDGLFPHHAFNVFFVGVGKITGAVSTTLLNMNKCRPSWGTVIKVRENTLIVRSSEITYGKGAFILADQKEKEVGYLPLMTAKIKPGDIVAIHWDFAGLILSREQQEQLETYTLRLMNLLSTINNNQEIASR